VPLINFKTNLTNLRFGADQPGGGDSGQPFIQNPIETANTPTETKRFYELNRTSLDFPIRGGAISSLVNGSYTTQAAVIDAARIKKFFNSSPRGTAFIQKQKGLQLTNPKTQVPNALEFAGLGIGNAIIPTTQAYNPNSTLAQIGVQGNGTHFNRQGVSPTIYESVKQTYQYIAGAPENNTATTNRLAILKALKLNLNSNFNFTTNSNNGISIDPDLVDRLGISTIQSQLFNYPGGPGSNYGIGFTRIFRATNSQGVAVSTQPVGNVVTGVAYSSIGLTYSQLANQVTYSPASPTDVSVQDFREQLTGPQVTGQYSTYNIADPNYSPEGGGIGIGNPGAPFVHTDYTQTNPFGVDLLNKKNLFYYNASTQTPWSAAIDPGGQNNTKDIIKFAFECMSNDYAGDAVALVFRAFLEGTISDTNQAEYSTFKYLGRGETFRTYQGFDRSVGFTFKIFPQSREELLPLYRKLNHLVSQIYPDYSPTSNLMRGNVVKLTIGDYLYRVPGFLDNVNITIDNTNTSWEIVLNPNETDVAQLPHLVTVSVSFKPIMDFLPRRETYEQSYVPIIANGVTYPDTVIDNPNSSATNRSIILAKQAAEAQQAVSQGQTDAAVAIFRAQHPISANNILGGKYAQQVAAVDPANNGKGSNGYPAPKKPSNAIIPNQNAVIYDSTGKPILNPYGFLGGTNGTKKLNNLPFFGRVINKISPGTIGQ